MARRLALLFAAVLLLLFGAAGCGGNDGRAASVRATTAPAGTRPPDSVQGGRCPVTRPNGVTPPGQAPDRQYYSNGKLWTVLWPGGVVVATGDQVLPDGSVRMKFGWWRGVEGQLTIQGRRLDGPSRPLRAEIPDGYGPTGFQATGIYFPTTGCWEVTGRVSAVSLTFVTRVVTR